MNHFHNLADVTPLCKMSSVITGLAGWRRQTKSDQEEDQGETGLDRRESKSDLQVHRPRGRMSFRTASHATLSFLSARKRIEDGIKTIGKKMVRRDSSDGETRCYFSLSPVGPYHFSPPPAEKRAQA